MVGFGPALLTDLTDDLGSRTPYSLLYIRAVEIGTTLPPDDSPSNHHMITDRDNRLTPPRVVGI